MSSDYLANHFLIAMPQMQDPNFLRTVTLLCQHDENGSMGVIINRPMDGMSMTNVIEQLNVDLKAPSASLAQPVFCGGPVQPELGMVLHDAPDDWQSTIKVAHQFGLTTSMEIIHAMARDEGPAHSLFILGYAGWGSGQLERELRENAWLSVPADPEIVFNTDIEQRWALAAQKLGIDLNTISTQSGHA